MRGAVVAGTFYPADAKKLRKMIAEMLKKAKRKKFGGSAVAAIVPHAGYEYSGWVAASAYLEIKKADPHRIVLAGPSHREYIGGAYSFDENWSGPLGEVKVSPAGLPIMKHDSEHSLEVQVPFLQETLGNFGRVPIIYGEISAEMLAEAIKKEDGFVVVSSDLSHYLPYEEAGRIDKNTLQKILDLDAGGLEREGDACGLTGITALVLIAKERGWKPVLLDYRNSGDITGDKGGVVGYASIIFTE
jgi:AmmeMemoRadiSam system protein B